MRDISASEPPRPLIYLGMCCDLVHHGHIAIIKHARQVGHVVIGLLTDSAISSYKRAPLLPYDARKSIVTEIKGVELVIPQQTLSYTENLLRLRPEFVMHGDDWKQGVQQTTRAEVIAVISLWGGRLLETPYTSDVSSTRLRQLLGA